MPALNEWVEVLEHPVHLNPSQAEHSVGQLLHLLLVLSWIWLIPHLQVVPVLVRVAPLEDQLAHVLHWLALEPEQEPHEL